LKLTGEPLSSTEISNFEPTYKELKPTDLTNATVTFTSISSLPIRN